MVKQTSIAQQRINKSIQRDTFYLRLTMNRKTKGTCAEVRRKRIPEVSVSILYSPWSLAAEVGRMSVYRKKNPKENQNLFKSFDTYIQVNKLKIIYKKI